MFYKHFNIYLTEAGVMHEQGTFSLSGVPLPFLDNCIFLSL